jgi:hypothetical protein
MTDTWSPKIADFMVQALDLEIDSAELVPEIVPLKRDAQSGISAVELQSSVGPTPFLVYHYLIADDRTQLDTDLATLEKATQLETPGPRIVAHAVAGDEAYILATTPTIQRALTGKKPVPVTRSKMALQKARTRVPDRIIDKLREVNSLAGDWLAAIDDASAKSGGGALELTEQEAALALFLLDEQSIQDLLRALNVLITSARQTAGESLK